METGETGRGGLTAPRLAEQGEETDQEDAPTLWLLMEAENVRDQTMSRENATQILVQVNPFLYSCISQLFMKLMFMEVIQIKNTEVTKSSSQFLEKNNCLVEGMGFEPMKP